MLAQWIDRSYALEDLLLLPFWFILEAYALFLGVGAVRIVFSKPAARWRALQLGLFPFLFGAISVVLIHNYWGLGKAWWFYVLALVPCGFGLVGIVGSIMRRTHGAKPTTPPDDSPGETRGIREPLTDRHR